MGDPPGEGRRLSADGCGRGPSDRAAMVPAGPLRRSLDDVEEMYTRLGTEVFQQTRLKGTTKLLWEHSYYDTEVWKNILRRHLGEQRLISFNRDEHVPKVSILCH